MRMVYARAAGLDVHKTHRGLSRSQRRAGPGRTRGALVRDDDACHRGLADWLAEAGVTHVAMESTGVYWKPIWNLLEGIFELILVNAEHIKAVPGRKTDVKDSQWIAELLQHGLLRPSFVPEKPVSGSCAT